MRLLHELKRRNVFRVAGLYLVGAWLLVQVAGTVLPWLNMPATILRGLAITLAFAWLFKLTPHGSLLPAVRSSQ